MKLLRAGDIEDVNVAAGSENLQNLNIQNIEEGENYV
ncbi:hypothetical protein CLIT_2c03080 [Peptoclostridium litorale DSM 5388]|uniref:Uncharacterized protein n=1 Tax=Peptoclostridium litorale DSM 5388 TaxID=1121324 RepID=A0A069RRA1_PEPLI|nr:hypothetical protein CLIT_2c03080 [Peptoclostridium litorale DSM 5388]